MLGMIHAMLCSKEFHNMLVDNVIKPATVGNDVTSDVTDSKATLSLGLLKYQVVDNGLKVLVQYSLFT